MNLHETLYVSDLDGTLLNDEQLLSQESSSFLVDAISKGLNFTYATARSITSSQFVLDSLNLKLPVILYNGAQIFCPIEKRYIHTAYLTPHDYLSQLKTFQHDGFEPVVHCVDENDELKVYFRSVSNESTIKWLNSRLAKGDNRFRITKDFSEVIHSKVIELMVVVSEEKFARYEGTLSCQKSMSYVFSEDIYCKGHFWLELTHRNANKGYAVQVLKEHLRLKHVVCFGDNHNDLPMFEKSTKSLAVSNSKASLQKCASGVIASNNENAVVHYIKESMAN